MLVLVCLEIELILTQDRCTFVPNIPQARKSFWTHPIELLGARFAPNVPLAQKSFWTHPMVLLGRDKNGMDIF
jgi:hypothetical protein